MNFIHKILFPPWQEGESNFCFCASVSRVNHPRQQWRYHLASCGHKCFAFGREYHVIAINQTQFPREGYPSALGASTHTRLQTCIVGFFCWVFFFRTVKIFIENCAYILWNFYRLAWRERVIKWLFSPAKGLITCCYTGAQFKRAQAAVSFLFSLLQFRTKPRRQNSYRGKSVRNSISLHWKTRIGLNKPRTPCKLRYVELASWKYV